MTNQSSVQEKLGWVATVAGGVWLSARVALWVGECLAGFVGAHPVRHVVAEALADQQDMDKPMVHAFQEALAAQETPSAAA